MASVPEIFHARDDDGDGRCDTREAWFTGFKAGNPQHLVNGFCWGLDGWLHGANGDSGGDVVCVKTGEKIRSAATIFGFIQEPENSISKPAPRSAASGGMISATGSATTTPRPAGTTGCR